MLIAVYARAFQKELALAIKRGMDVEKLKEILRLIAEEQPLPVRCRNHKLKGEFVGYWECQVVW